MNRDALNQEIHSANSLLQFLTCQQSLPMQLYCCDATIWLTFRFYSTHLWHCCSTYAYGRKLFIMQNYFSFRTYVRMKYVYLCNFALESGHSQAFSRTKNQESLCVLTKTLEHFTYPTPFDCIQRAYINKIA